MCVCIYMKFIVSFGKKFLSTKMHLLAQHIWTDTYHTSFSVPFVGHTAVNWQIIILFDGVFMLVQETINDFVEGVLSKK